MFTKNIGIIFFILYLKAAILEMSSQLNNNQINNNSTSVENYNINENENVHVDNGNEISLKSLVTGKYQMFFSHYHVVHLFINNKHYCINSYDSSNICGIENDEFMYYDLELHKYILTQKAVSDDLGINMYDLFHSSNDPDKDIQVFLMTRNT